MDCESWGQFPLKCVISHPVVTCTIPGTAKVYRVVDNIGAASGRIPGANFQKRQKKFFDSLQLTPDKS